MSVDVWSIPVPDTHLWAIFGLWVAGYIGMRIMIGGIR